MSSNERLIKLTYRYLVFKQHLALFLDCSHDYIVTKGLTMFSGSSFFTVIFEEHIVWAFYLIPVGTLLLIRLCQWVLFRKSCLTEKERGHYIKFWEGAIVKWIHPVQNRSDLTLTHLFNIFSSYDNCVMDGVWEFT